MIPISEQSLAHRTKAFVTALLPYYMIDALATQIKLRENLEIRPDLLKNLEPAQELAVSQFDEFSKHSGLKRLEEDALSIMRASGAANHRQALMGVAVWLEGLAKEGFIDATSVAAAAAKVLIVDADVSTEFWGDIKGCKIMAHKMWAKARSLGYFVQTIA